MKTNVFFTLLVMFLGANLLMAQEDSGDVLYSQMDDTYGTWDYVYSFEYFADPTLDSYGADDFEVPAGETWEIFSVKSIMNASDAGTTMNVFIYADDAGQPGAELHHFDNVTTNNVVTLPGLNIYEIETNLPSTVSLTEGVYWISISNEKYSDWDSGNWLYQQTAVTVLSSAHIINPGGGYGFIPTTWTPEPWSSYKNLSFALYAPPVPNDLTISEIVSPVSGELTANQVIEVVISNVGSQAQNAFDVQYQVNGGTIVVESVSTTILPNESYNHVFATTADMSALGDYTIEVTVILPGDENPGNDSYSTTVTNYGPIYELNANSTTVTACNGLFTDAGGLFNGFESTDGGTITFYPETSGSRVSLNFTAFDFGYNTHHFVIYDGETTTDNILYTYVETWHGYGEHNDPPTYIRARNITGALTIELITYQYMYGADPGWVAEIACMVPEDIDFTVVDMQLSDGFYYLDMPVQITSNIVNSGATAQSRLVSLYEEGSQVASATSAILNPGEIEEINFTWYPQSTGNDISISIVIEDDPGGTNGDNSIEKLVNVYSEFALLESFEGSFFLPEYWDAKIGDFEKEDYGALHGEYFLKTPYGGAPIDTLITPLLDINIGDKLSFWAKGGDKDFDIIYSQSKNGPWEVLASYPAALGWSWEYFETDLGVLADDNFYFIGFAHSDNGMWSGTFSLDMISGPDKKFFDHNLMVFDYEMNQFPATGREAKYSIKVKNMGLQDVAGPEYTIKLMVNTAEEIASLQGIDITSFGVQSFDFYYEFNDYDATEIYFEIDYDEDVDISNNTSESTSLYIQPEGTYDFFLEGDYDNPYPYDRYPIANSFEYSLSEMIYYPEEVQGTGTITGITLEYYATLESPYVPLKIWMGTTSESVVSDWITADQLQLVYDSTVTFDASSWEEMYFPLDTSFSYDGTDNLIIMIDKGSTTINGKVYFRTKDVSIYYKGMLVTDNANDIDPFNPDPSYYIQRFSHIPAMRFLIHTDNGMKFTTEPVKDGEKGVSYTYEASVYNNQGGDVTLSEGVYFPEWLTLTQDTKQGNTTATLSGVPNEIGDYQVQIYATDGSYDATQTFTIKVVPFIDFISNSVTVVVAGEEYLYNAEVTYNGYDDVFIEEGSSFPDWLTLEDNGDQTATISGTTDEVGYHQIDIVASDGTVEANQTIPLYIASVPEFVSDPITLVGENQIYEYNAVVEYEGSSPVIFVKGDAFPDWLSITDNENNTATISGATDQLGDYQVDIVGVGFIYKNEQSYTLTVGAIPEFTSEPVTVIEANQTYTYEITVNYNGEEPCAIIAGENMPSWMTLIDNGDNTATLSGIPSELNSYDVDLIAQGEHFDDTQSFTVDVMVGIEEITNDMVSIYPNPVKNDFYITNMNHATIHIMDMSGKVVKSIQVSSDNFKVNASDLQNGLYIIRSVDGQFNIYKKIIVN